jgi:hypothetical protein
MPAKALIQQILEHPDLPLLKRLVWKKMDQAGRLVPR